MFYGVLGGLAIIVVLFIYYNNFDRKKIILSKSDELILKWIGKEINLVDTLSVYDVRDNTFYKFDKLQLNSKKIAVYIDSNCFTCVEDFVRWKKIIEDLRHTDIQLLFYLHTTDFEQVKKYLLRWRFNYPVIIDRSNTFFNVNKISDKNLYKAMLLDKDNKVQIIGNPIVSKEIKELYLEEIQKTIKGE